MILLTVLSFTGLIFGVIALILGAVSLSIIIGVKNSTHTFMAVDPTKQNFSDFNEETRKILNNSDETLETIQ